MPLTADQQAMLQLLLERGQSYADLASLLGTDEAGVRTRARAALTELAGADPDRNVGLTDYLLGQADPIGRADAVRHLKDDPDDLELATELTQKLRLVAPAGRAPAPSGRGVAAPAPASAAPCRRSAPDSQSPAAKAIGGAVARGRSQRRAAAPGGPRTTLSRRQTQLMVALGSGAVLVVAVVLAVSGAFSSGSDDSTSSTTTSTTPTAASTGPQGFPVTDVKIPNSGKYHNAFAIPKAFQTLLPRTQAVYLTLAEKKVVAKAIKKAVSSGQPIIRGGGQDGVHRHRQLGKRFQGRHTHPLDGQQGRLGLRRRRPRSERQPAVLRPAADGRQAGAEGLGLHRVVRARLGRSAA